ncbi:hypothetical protein AAVH_12048 [Aphelenchoides avenae]|nr:hypothetical protein AAVH_12048 [Aphelenchus avenae]
MLPDYGAAIIMTNDPGRKVLTNGGKEYLHSSKKYGYDHFRCAACVQELRRSDCVEDKIKSNVVTVKVSGLDTDNPRLRSDLNLIRHFCCTGYVPASAKRKATMDANDRLAKRRRPKYEEDVDEPDIFGPTVPMMDGSYGYWLEERAIMLRYKEDGKVSAEIRGAKDVNCVLCSELDPLYDCRAVIFRGNFVLFDPAKGDGDNVHICLKEADETKQVQQPMVSHVQAQSSRPPSPAESEQQGVDQMIADVLDAGLEDPDALLNDILAHADAIKTELESQRSDVDNKCESAYAVPLTPAYTVSSPSDTSTDTTIGPHTFEMTALVDVANSVQPVDSSPLAHSSPVVSPPVAGGRSIAGSSTASVNRFDDDVIVLSDSDDEDVPASAAPSARVKAEPTDATNSHSASVFGQTLAQSTNLPSTLTGSSHAHVPDVKPPRVIPVLRPSGVPMAYKNKAFGKADFVTDGSETFAVYKKGLDGVHHKFKQLSTFTESLEGEMFEVGIYECYDCELFLAEEGLTAAIGQVKVANGYFVDSHPRLPERIPHCCKPTPQRR